MIRDEAVGLSSSTIYDSLICFFNRLVLFGVVFICKEVCDDLRFSFAFTVSVLS